jgi:ABC-type lipoprotein release transport system permease subunit
MGIDPEKEALLSNVRSRLVRYRLTDENIEKLANAGLPAEIRDNLKLFSGNSYANDFALAVDLDIGDDDTAAVMPLFRRFARFENGYIREGEPGALIGDRLATFLQAGVGDTLVLLGQGYHGATAAGKFRINGIVKLPAPDLDNKIVYLPFDISQDLYGAPGMLTSLAVCVEKNDDPSVDNLITEIGRVVDPPLRVMGWREMNKLMVNQMDADSKSGMIMIFILYLVIAFGIFGTVLMMTAERRREFGVLVAIGMQKTKLSAVIIIEMLYVGLLGIASGIAASLPVILYGHANPIRFHGEMAKMYEDYGMEAVMPFLLPDMYMIWQSVVVAVIIIIALIYPLRKIGKMQVVNSLKA